MIQSIMLTLTIDKNETMCMKGKTSWVDPIIYYLGSGTLLEDKKEANKVKKLSSLFYLENDRFYDRGFSFPLLQCLHLEETNYVLGELHEGIYASHVVGSTLALSS